MFVGPSRPLREGTAAMNFRPLLATFALVAIASSPLAATATTTVAYIPNTSSTVTPACTTKDAQQPTDAQRANVPSNNWYMSPPQSQMTTRVPYGRSVNDAPSPMSLFPIVFQQPVDKDKNAKPLAVSTCDKP